MGIIKRVTDGIREWLWGIGDEKYKQDPYMNYCSRTSDKEAFKVYALMICINKIANAISMSDFVTTKPKGRTTENYKGDIWYWLNVSPNVNQTSSEFYQKLVRESVLNPNGALIVQLDGQLVIADDYSVKEYAIVENIYSQVKIGNLVLERTFKESEILRIKMNNADVSKIVSDIYADYGALISGAIRNYNKGNAEKLWVKLGTSFNQLEQRMVTLDDGTEISEADRVLDDLFKNRLKDHFSEKDSATPIEDGIDIVESNSSSGASAKQKVTTRDITSLFDDIVNYTADAFGIPRGLLKGDVADIEAMTDNFINFCINPFVNLLEDELNRKLYKKDQVLKGERIKIKTTRIKSRDPIKIAASAEALYRIGAINPEYVRWLIGEDPIGDEESSKYGLTKNYEQK